MKQKIEGLGIVILFIIISSTQVLAVTVPPIQMADSLGVDDANVDPNMFVLIPVNITNVMNGPIQTIKFDVLYDNDKMTLNKIKASDLTASGWGTIALGKNKKSVTLNTADTSMAISNGAIGTVVLLNFSIKNKPGTSGWINITNIDFSDTNNHRGNAPARNGLFTVNLGTPVDTHKGKVHLSTGSGVVDELITVDPKSLPKAPPSGANLEYGLFRFKIKGVNPGDSATLILTFPNDLPAGTTYLKYGPTTADNSPHWYTIPSTIDIINRKQLTITLVDGGDGDDDLAANGNINDDSGPSLPQPLPPVPELPTVVLTTAGVIGLLSIVRRMK